MLFFYLVTLALCGSQHSFGRGSGPIFLDYVSCSWLAASLLSCSHNGFGVTSCSHSNDVGVVCSTCKLYVLYETWFAVVFGINVYQEILWYVFVDTVQSVKILLRENLYLYANVYSCFRIVQVAILLNTI